jgi:hypothetical protein
MAVVGTPHKISKQAAKSLPTPHLPFIFTVLYINGGHLRKRRSQNSEVQFKLIAQANKLASLGVTREGRVTPGERSGRGQSDRSYIEIILDTQFKLSSLSRVSSYVPVPTYLGQAPRTKRHQPQPHQFLSLHLVASYAARLIKISATLSLLASRTCIYGGEGSSLPNFLNFDLY